MMEDCKSCVYCETGSFSYDNWCVVHRELVADIDTCNKFKVIEEDKLIISVKLAGCDDTTYIRMSATESELKFLERLSKLSEEISSYPCMPVLRVVAE